MAHKDDTTDTTYAQGANEYTIDPKLNSIWYDAVDDVVRVKPAPTPDTTKPSIDLHTLENLTTPLGLLDNATREALIAHGGPYEAFCRVAEWNKYAWSTARYLSREALAYRVKR